MHYNNKNLNNVNTGYLTSNAFRNNIHKKHKMKSYNRCFKLLNKPLINLIIDRERAIALNFQERTSEYDNVFRCNCI